MKVREKIRGKKMNEEKEQRKKRKRKKRKARKKDAIFNFLIEKGRFRLKEKKVTMPCQVSYI